MTRKIEYGFTFIEIILYVGIVAVFLTGAVSFGWNVITVSRKSMVEQEVVANSRAAVRRIGVEIRNAQSVTTVSGSSITLAYADSARNPTVISKTGKQIFIGWGAAGSCPTSSPCALTSSNVDVQNLNFTDYSNAGNTTDNVRFEVVMKSNYSGGRDWFFRQYATASAEVRSK